MSAAVLITVAPVSMHAQQHALSARIESVLTPLARKGELSGTVLVAHKDTIVFERSYGTASVEQGSPNANRTRYRIHSISKQFTAMAVMVLVHDGRVDLGASVRTYLPELPVAWQDVTIRQMLTHTSGVPNREDIWAKTFEDNDVESQLQNLALVAPKLAADTLVEKPGTKWRYNNFVYDLLACVVERASRSAFPYFVRTRIFEPAGMTDAGFDERRSTGAGAYVSSAVVPRLAHGYNGTPDRLQSAAPQMYASAGAGGIYLTAEDLLHYDRALTSGAIVPANVVREMVDSAYVISPTASYGYGWIIHNKATNALGGSVEHSGGNNGYVADYVRYPKVGVTIIVLTNRGFTSLDPIIAGIGNAVESTLLAPAGHEYRVSPSR